MEYTHSQDSAGVDRGQLGGSINDPAGGLTWTQSNVSGETLMIIIQPVSWRRLWSQRVARKPSVLFSINTRADIAEVFHGPESKYKQPGK